MTADLSKFEQILLDLQTDVLGVSELVDDAAQTVELDQNRVGRLSRMDAMQGQAMAQASSKRQQQQLLQIEKALLRIEQGSYGECHECGEMITENRLEADPIALYCISCAEKLEGY